MGHKANPRGHFSNQWDTEDRWPEPEVSMNNGWRAIQWGTKFEEMDWSKGQQTNLMGVLSFYDLGAPHHTSRLHDNTSFFFLIKGFPLVSGDGRLVGLHTHLCSDAGLCYWPMVINRLK